MNMQAGNENQQKRLLASASVAFFLEKEPVVLWRNVPKAQLSPGVLLVGYIDKSEIS